MIQAVDSFEANASRTGQGQTHINTLVLSVLHIRLFDPFEYPMPGSPFRLTLGERTIEGKADDNAWIEIRVVDVPEQATIEWGKVEEEEEEIPQGPGYPEASDESSRTDIEAQPKAKATDSAPAQPQKKDSINYLYEREIYLAFDADEEKAAEQRLHNLCYNVWKDVEATVRAFQLTYNRPLSGKVSDIKAELWTWHDDCGPKRFPKLEEKHTVK